MDTRVTSSTTPPSPPTRAGGHREPDEPWGAVLAGVCEALVVCDDGAVVRRANDAAHAMLPGLVVGEVVDVARCRALAEAVYAGVEELTVDLDGDRRVRARSRRIAPDAVCWYLLDVTNEHRRADSLLAAQERAQFLGEAGRALHGVLNLDRTMRTVVARAVPRLAPAALVLVNPGGDEVHWARAGDGTDRPATGRLPLGDLRAAPHLRAALAGGGPADPWAVVELAELDLWPGDGGPGPVAVPVPTNGVTHAVLVLAVDDLGADAELITEYAARAGSALAAAALYREQSHLGGVLQESLVPPPLPTTPGPRFGAAYRPARESLRVGGDFYEVIPPSAGRVTSFLLGDVCGKGIEAAVLSGRVRQSLHALRLLERRPRTLLELLNTALLDAAAVHAEAPRFATMVLGDAEPQDDGTVRVRLATGGHPSPLVVRVDGTVETVDLAGTLVGAVRDATFAETTLTLAPGDTCLLYSDGVTEARGPAGFFGEERLEAALAACGGAPVEVLCDRMVQLVSAWLDGADHDDIALLAVGAAHVRDMTGHDRPDHARGGAR